ncbi:unnamed protein product [Jaminaea pallidilutea]
MPVQGASRRLVRTDGSSRHPDDELALLLNGRGFPIWLRNAKDPVAAYRDALVQDKEDLLSNVGKTYVGKDGKLYYCRPCRPCQTKGRPCPKEYGVRCGHCCNAGGRISERREDYRLLKAKLVAKQTWGQLFKSIAIPQGTGYLKKRNSGGSKDDSSNDSSNGRGAGEASAVSAPAQAPAAAAPAAAPAAATTTSNPSIPASPPTSRPPTRPSPAAR